MDATTQAFRWADRARDKVASASPAGAWANVIQLGGGYGFPDELPDIAAEAVAAAEAKAETLQYGPLYGLDDLRDAIVDYLRADGITAVRENILVVNGAKQGLDLACRVFLEKGDAIIVAAPTYLTAADILKGAETAFVSVPQDEDGLDAAHLERALEELLATSDVVSLHLCLDEATRGFLSAARIAAMKRGVILVNTARGAILDEAALVAALRSGHVEHAALDVFATEPLPTDDPLRTAPNVTLTAHCGFWTERSTINQVRLAMAIVQRLQGRGDDAP